MKIIISEITPGEWSIQQVTSIGVVAGSTTYPSSKEAGQVSRTQHPEKEVEITFSEQQ